MCIYIYIHTHVCVYSSNNNILSRLPRRKASCVHVCMHACMRVCVYACMHVARMRVCVYACMHVCIYAHVCMYTYMRVCMYACMCMYACIYVHVRTHGCMRACMCACLDLGIGEYQGPAVHSAPSIFALGREGDVRGHAG